MPRVDLLIVQMFRLKNYNLFHLFDKLLEFNYNLDRLQQQFAKLI